MSFFGTPFSRGMMGGGVHTFGLGYQRRPSQGHKPLGFGGNGIGLGMGNRPLPTPPASQYSPQPQTQSSGLGASPSSTGLGLGMGQSPQPTASSPPTVGLGSGGTPPTQYPNIASPYSSSSSSQPLDPFGTQASGGQYGNLSGTPSIFGASTYAPTPYQGPNPNGVDSDPRVALAKAQVAASGPVDFAAEAAKADAIRAVYAQGGSVPGHAQLQVGQQVGGQKWNGTAWVPSNTYVPSPNELSSGTQQNGMTYLSGPGGGWFGGSNPGGY